ncbi:MAG: substrate-binding domain-containing protein [Actinomycetes bacterium]
MKKTCLPLALLATAALTLSGPSVAVAKPTITMSGSTSVYPLMTTLVPAFLKEKGSPATFKLYQGGSDVGVADAAYGRVTIGMSSRDERGADPHGMTWNKFARDAICLITNKANPITNLNQSQVNALYTGSIASWKDVTGAKLTTSVALLTRTVSSGTQDMFEKLFLGFGQHVTSRAAAKATNGLVQQAVKSNKNAIGYVSAGFTAGTNVVGYEGYACTLSNAKSGQYPAVRNFWLVTRGNPEGVVATFINWAQNSAAAQRLVAKGYVPLN